MEGKKNRAKPSASNGNTVSPGPVPKFPMGGIMFPVGMIDRSDVAVVPAPTTLRGAFRELFRAWGRFWRYLWVKKEKQSALSVAERDELNRIVAEVFDKHFKHDNNGKK